MSVRKNSTRPSSLRHVWNSIDIVVVRDTKGCFNEFIRSEGKYPRGRSKNPGGDIWAPVDRSEDQRTT